MFHSLSIFQIPNPDGALNPTLSVCRLERSLCFDCLEVLSAPSFSVLDCSSTWYRALGNNLPRSVKLLP